MNLEKNLLYLFKELYEKQDVLSKVCNEDLFDKYGNSEIHCIDAIGIMGEANGTQIAEHMKVTRSAVSKIIRRLLKDCLVNKYQKPDNKKEVFYRLSNKGQTVFEKHQKAHEKWEQRDTAFLRTINEKDKQTVLSFLQNFNNYLDELIKENEN
ncbi:transcriptional regulator [Gottschalkia purinilytica]|uniref:Transcriptional regulator n=1 Tax=Gottschalkia purinilytica TaxID=1503 RepID=A0A0L0W7Y4_GOTPU|nr:MarR family transcriptional regulator [Gottschalkia purinilytica]KNF07683.1 transcriptional regulator [Gottschalkia purinilytica]